MPKGIYPKSVEHKRKLSLVLKGRKLSSQQRAIRLPLLAIYRAQRMTKKETFCAVCGTKFFFHPGYEYGVFCSERCRVSTVGRQIISHKLRRLHQKSGNTKGMIYKIIRRSLFWRRWREAIFERDKYVCVFCGDSSGGNLNADHYPMTFAEWMLEVSSEYGGGNLVEKVINYEPMWKIETGRTLCEDCHRKTPSFGKSLERWIRYQLVNGLI